MYNHYVSIDALQFSERRKSEPRRPHKLSKEDWQEIEQSLKRHWSPETIVGVHKREGKTCVSIEWLYHIIRQDKQKGGTLYTYLPHHLTKNSYYLCTTALHFVVESTHQKILATAQYKKSVCVKTSKTEDRNKIK